MKGILRTATLLVCLISLLSPTTAQERAGATEAEYGNIIVNLNTAKWGQNRPFNKMCFTASGAQAKTGCVPTAYAILMHHYQWPASAIEKKVYHSGTGESIVLGQEYDWANMLHDYTNGYSEEEADAVATLMRDLGWAYGVEYGTGATQSGSGGEGAAKLVEVFKYKSETPNSQNAQYSTVRDVVADDDKWISYIKQSLDAGCPIPYSSITPSGGRHIFILDGYTDKDYFHFNWGWGGQGNGWFKLDEMKPDAYSDYSKSHRAYFMLKPDVKTCTISVAVNDSNAGNATVNGEASVTINQGATVTLSATPNAGYAFVEWTLNGECISKESTYTTKASADAEYIANFKEVTGNEATAEYSIKVESTAGGNATVNGKSEITAKQGDILSLLATPEEGYTFIEWRVGTEVVSTEMFFTTSAQCDRVYNAIFEELKETVTIEVKGSGGYAYVGDGTDRKQKVAKGSSVYIKATPAEGTNKKFAYWSKGNTVASGKGVIFSNENPYQFIANSDAVFFVNFVPEETDLNVTIKAAATTGGNATIYGKQEQSIALGSKIILEAKADTGYHFTCWTIGEDVVSTEPVYTTVAQGAVTYTANFEVISTGIDQVTKETENDVYDLLGRKTSKATNKGIYIIDEKIILVK